MTCRRTPTRRTTWPIPKNPDYAPELLASINAKLNALITAEIGDDQALFDLPKSDRSVD